MNATTSVDEGGIVSRDRVCERLQAILRAAQTAGWTDDALEQASGVKARTIKSYRVECKQPSLAAALSIAAVLGPKAINPILNLIGMQAEPLEGSDALHPGAIVADIATSFAAIAAAAADGRFDHTEMPGVTSAADIIIATVLPLSSAGRGQG